MDDASAVPSLDRRLRSCILMAVLAAGGCQTYVGTTARSFLNHVRSDPDPNARYVAYSKLASSDAYDTEAQKREAVDILMEKFERGKEPVASRAMICRTLGELRDPRSHDLLVKAVSNSEAVIKVEACRALGKVGRPEDATVLAQTMSIDSLEDARIAAIEGLAELKSKDPRIYKVLLDGMEHEDPAIRLASLNALRSLTHKDMGTDPADWRGELRSKVAGSGAPVLPVDETSKPAAPEIGVTAAPIERSTAPPPAAALSPLEPAPRL
jgi:HEAT repeat protein